VRDRARCVAIDVFGVVMLRISKSKVTRMPVYARLRDEEALYAAHG
jgi:hypothetical protein